jgi:hypothetical protein
LRRLRPADLVFLGLCVFAFVYILWLGRSGTFRQDDWTFIGERDWLSLNSWMAPNNEHWSLSFLAVFRSIFAVFGMHSYLPYLAALLAIHVIGTAGLYRLLDHLSGPVVALGGASLVLFLGTAHENFYWAASIGFVGATAAGLWALVALVQGSGPRSAAAAAVLLVASEAFAGVGLFFVAAAGALVMVDPSQRRRWMAVGIPVAVYVVWYLIWGRQAVNPITPDSISGLPSFALLGMANAIHSMLGVGRTVGEVAAAVLVGGVAWRLLRGQNVPPLAVAGVVGLVAQFVLIGLVRDDGVLGAEMSLAPRYVYSAVIFVLVAVAALVGKAASTHRELVRVMVLGPALAVGLTLNVQALVEAAPAYQRDAEQIRATFAALDEYADAPAVINSKRTPLPIEMLRSLVRDHGSPVRDDIRPTVVLGITSEGHDRALVALTRESFTVEETNAADWAVSSPTLLDTFHTRVLQPGGCWEVTSLGPDSQVEMAAPSGSSFIVTTDYGGDLGVFLYHMAAPDEANSSHLEVTAGTAYLVRVPDMGPGFVWQLRFKLPVGSHLTSVCMATPQ